ncbi:LysR family transcriptional regulator [Oceanobacillus bengalensis]|uniref:LysR family transcriptional regulator n=1 Tax=Oceanobacillus bengalensis TaxID=1435466 RepID=A0A494Z7H1_9BACI|nr:LysR family transcriptional regulator [Oceanobacillus bengalensis]RKQ18543.1 LysR family transcriptional regulator [Oceanobacillus bengalensis]
MSIEQLTYIVEVAKSKSLAAAAKNLNISQSALSQAITKLESELNVKIFIRSRAGVITTREGDRLIEKAQNVLYSIFQLKKEANQINNFNDSLRISLIPGLISPIVDTYLSFKEKGSNLKIEVNEKASLKIVEDIKNDEIDTGFIAVNKGNFDLVTGLQFTPITEGKLLVYASERSGLTHSNKSILPDVLKEQQFVLYKDEYVLDFVSNFQRLFGPIDIFFQTTNLEIINKAVVEHGAVTIGHDISTKFQHPTLSSKRVKALDTGDLFDTSFKFGWIKKFDYKLSEEAKLYIEEVNSILM